jgi:hypothetical protein
VADPRRLAAALIADPHVDSVTLLSPLDAAPSLELTTRDLAATARALPRHAEATAQVLTAVTSPDADLESLYRYLVTHTR